VLIDSDKGMAEQVAQCTETGLRSDPNEPALSVSIGIGIGIGVGIGIYP
jgi:hypothetical protein